MELRSTISDSYTIAIGKRVDSKCLSINFLNKTLNICSKGPLLGSVTLVTEVTVKIGNGQ